MHPLAGATVLQIVSSLDSSAPAQAALDIAAALAAAGARPLVACAGGPLKSELQAKGGIFIPFPAQAKNPLAMALNIRRLAQIIAAERADIVHVRSRAAAWVALGATRLTRTPLVTSFTSSGRSANPVALRYNSVLARGDLVLATSRYAANVAAKCNPSARNIRIVHPGVDCRFFSPGAVSPSRVQAIREAWNVAPHERIIFVPFQPKPGSGHELTVRAAGLLMRSGLSGVKFIFEGNGGGRGFERALAREGLQAIVRCGQATDMPAALLAASAVVLPAGEALASGAAAIQAQAMGTPAIAAREGAAPELLLAPPDVDENARTGFLFPPGDAPALALSLAKVLSLGAAAAERLSARAARHAQNFFSSEGMCADTLEAYAAALRERELGTQHSARPDSAPSGAGALTFRQR
ncbi:MAG TPA: glycosyltransferase [Methylocella sp.]|nr:glycosyltransferase [Methylocella sp.]